MKPVRILLLLSGLALFPPSGVTTSTAQERAPAEQKGQAAAAISWHGSERWKSLGPIGFRLRELPDDSFLVIFPEWITSREMSWHVKPQWKTKAHRARAIWHSGPYSLQLQMQFHREKATRTLAWEYRFTNGSQQPLRDVAAFNCLNLVDAASFIDLKMKRTWVGDARRARVSLADVKKTRGPRTMQFYPARDGLPLAEFERFSRYHVTSQEQLAGDRIGVRSRDGKWTIECIVDGPVAYFFNNWESDHGCIHAAPLFGDIPAGETGSARGRIVFTRLEAK